MSTSATANGTLDRGRQKSRGYPGRDEPQVDLTVGHGFELVVGDDPCDVDGGDVEDRPLVTGRAETDPAGGHGDTTGVDPAVSTQGVDDPWVSPHRPPLGPGGQPMVPAGDRRCGGQEPAGPGSGAVGQRPSGPPPPQGVLLSRR